VSLWQRGAGEKTICAMPPCHKDTLIFGDDLNEAGVVEKDLRQFAGFGIETRANTSGVGGARV
jgi:hypothetical protein